MFDGLWYMLFLSLEMLDKPDDVHKLPFHMYHETHEIQEKAFPITIEVRIEPQVHRTDPTKKKKKTYEELILIKTLLMGL